MNSYPYINIHTHTIQPDNDWVTVQNLMPGNPISAFKGNNFYSVGLHPWYLKSIEENNQLLGVMKKSLKLNHVIFVGECGLDKLTGSAFSEQARTFEAQAFMAKECHKPLIIHCVKAWNELFEIYKKINPTAPWILHGYNGSKEITQRLLNERVFFSFGELLLKERTKINSSIKLIPLERIFFETDTSTKGLEYIYARGAALKGISVIELRKVVWENFNRIENISLEIR